MRFLSNPDGDPSAEDPEDSPAFVASRGTQLYRTACLLTCGDTHLWEDRSIEDTAAALRPTSSAVRSRSFRALARVRELLGSDFAEFAENCGVGVALGFGLSIRYRRERAAPGPGGHAVRGDLPARGAEIPKYMATTFEWLLPAGMAIEPVTDVYTLTGNGGTRWGRPTTEQNYFRTNAGCHESTLGKGQFVDITRVTARTSRTAPRSA